MKLSAATTVALAAQVCRAADAGSWKSRSIYFALTDRIARSSNDAGGSACQDLGNYCGGTFRGLQGKLDYIKNLGFDAIWITPVVASKCACEMRAVSPCSAFRLITGLENRRRSRISRVLGSGSLHRECQVRICR